MNHRRRPPIRSRREDGRSAAGLDAPVHDALTDLHAYALLLDVERARLGQRIEEPAGAECDVAIGELVRLRARLDEEVDALREAASALRDDAQAGLRSALRQPPRLRPGPASRRVPPPGSGSPPGA